MIETDICVCKMCMGGNMNMEKYIGIGFVILYLTVLAGVIGILEYQFHLSKEKVDISPAKTNTNKSNKTTNE